MPKAFGYCRLSKEEITAKCAACEYEWALDIKDPERIEYDCPNCDKTHHLSRTDPVSIQAQIDKVEQLAQTKVPRNVDPNLEILVDVNVSGSIPIRDRAQGAVLLQQLRDGDYVIAAKLDRLFRDLLDCVQQIKFFRENHIKLVLGDFPDLDISSPVGEMVLQMLAVFAEFERKRIAERTREGLKKRKALGQPTNNKVPRGYSLMCTRCDHIYNYQEERKGRFCPGCKCARKGHTRFTPNKMEQELMWRLLWHRSCYNFLEWDMIVSLLNTESMRTREGKKWTRTKLQYYFDDAASMLVKGELLEEFRPDKMQNLAISKLAFIPKKVREILEERDRKKSAASVNLTTP